MSLEEEQRCKEDFQVRRAHPTCIGVFRADFQRLWSRSVQVLRKSGRHSPGGVEFWVRTSLYFYGLCLIWSISWLIEEWLLRVLNLLFCCPIDWLNHTSRLTEIEWAVNDCICSLPFCCWIDWMIVWVIECSIDWLSFSNLLSINLLIDWLIDWLNGFCFLSVKVRKCIMREVSSQLIHVVVVSLREMSRVRPRERVFPGSLT